VCKPERLSDIIWALDVFRCHRCVARRFWTYCRLPGSYRETGLCETSTAVSKALPEVTSLGPNPQLLIALHSPDALLETGLRMCLPEKSRHGTASDAEQSVLRSPLCLGIIAKDGQLSRISEVEEPTFSALQTAWRSGKDSNPRYRSETCKSRRWRKLHGIKSFKNSLRLPASRAVVANRWGFRRIWKANPWRLCG
jgi:hypothetical protein